MTRDPIIRFYACAVAVVLWAVILIAMAAPVVEAMLECRSTP
jgi:hypothetical protein